MIHFVFFFLVQMQVLLRQRIQRQAYSVENRLMYSEQNLRMHRPFNQRLHRIFLAQKLLKMHRCHFRVLICHQHQHHQPQTIHPHLLAIYLQQLQINQPQIFLVAVVPVTRVQLTRHLFLVEDQLHQLHHQMHSVHRYLLMQTHRLMFLAVQAVQLIQVRQHKFCVILPVLYLVFLRGLT